MPSRIRIKKLIKKIIRFLKIAEDSSRKSKINFFFQMINFVLAVLLIMYILPDRVDDLISKWGEIKIFYTYLPKMGLAVFFYFIWWVGGYIFDFSFSTMFQTKLKLTISILISLILLLYLIYKKIIITLFIKVKRDINYLFYE